MNRQLLGAAALLAAPLMLTACGNADASDTSTGDQLAAAIDSSYELRLAATRSTVGDTNRTGRGCTIVGTAEGEQLRGTAGDDVICGRGGNDVIRGRGGHDTLIGGNGHDVLYGGRADDTLQGGSDQDFLYSRHRGHDLNTLRGNSGHDVFLTRDGHIDIIDGGNKRGEWDIACTDNQDVLRSAQHRDVCPGGPPTAQP